jgi:hypothetical protein
VGIGAQVALAGGALIACCSACGSGRGGGTFATGFDDASAPPAESEDAPADAAAAGEASSLAIARSDGGGSVSCQPGTYTGTYTGTADTSKVGGPTNFPISGPMAITLVGSGSQNGENFELVTNDATFDAVWGGVSTGDSASGLVVIQSMLTGQLDCGNESFSAMSTSADWTLLGIPAGTATVNFTGTYDPASASIAGNFNITSAISISTGTWTVTLESAGDP